MRHAESSTREHRVERGDVDAERGGALRDRTSDGAEADDTEGLSARLAPDEGISRPLAREHPCGGMVRAAQHQQRDRDHVLGDRDHVRAGGGVHRHAALGAGVEVDVVEPDPEPPDRDQSRPGREQRTVDAGAIADNQRPGRSEEAGDRRGVAVQVGVVADVEVGAQRVHRGLVHELGDHDVGHRSSMCCVTLPSDAGRATTLSVIPRKRKSVRPRCRPRSGPDSKRRDG